jgi:phage anti-repressor protein
MSVDIVNLIESNPITKLDSNYQSKLIEKIKINFTNYEQQLFLSSFYCYLKYDTKNDYVINLDNIWEWLGFSSKFNAKRLLEKTFNYNKDFILLLLQSEKQTNTTKGGHNKETFMLNIETFKKFCLKAGTKKADEVHDYFIKLENIMFEVTKEESEELKKQLIQIEDIKNKEMEEKIIKEKALEKQKVLLSKFGNSGNLIYIIRVKSYANGEYVVKIGYSDIGIKARYDECKTKQFEECLLLDCFPVQKSRSFEQFIHNHLNISCNNIKLETHISDRELFLIGKNLTYSILLDIINKNIQQYNTNDNAKEILELECQKLKLIDTINNSNSYIEEILNTNKILLEKMSLLEQQNKEILEKLNSDKTKTTTGFNQQLQTIGPRLQKINPETSQLIKVYETVTEAMNENKNIKRPSIMKAIQENTIYCDFRWQLVERNLDPNNIYDLQPTKVTKIQNLGYIAKLSSNKSQILNVYLDRKTAALENGYSSSSALDNPVKNNIISKGFYYCLYNNCSNELRSKFEENNRTPILYKDGVGQFNEENELVNEFTCKYDCIKSLNISDKTLGKSLDKNILYNGFYYKSLGSKLFI